MFHQLLTEAKIKCLQAYGEHHLLTTRLLLNTGIAYEIEGDYETAFANFKDLERVCLAVFGPGHPKTVRAVKTISDPKYARMKRAEEQQAAGMA